MRLHNARRSHAEPLAFQCLFLKSGDGVKNLRFRRKGGPHSIRRAARGPLGHSDFRNG